jgi:hypothetical protein
MSPELDNILCKRYPLIFANRGGQPTETLMCFGFEHGDGWFQMIQSMCSLIQNHINWKNREAVVVPQVVAIQVKEKFGGLRFYYEGGDAYIRGMTSMAEEMSLHICEECGKPGQTRSGGWIRVLCDEHANGRSVSSDNN